MRADLVVMTPPIFDDDPGLLQGIEDLAIEQFIPKLRVEALAIAILPGAAGFDVGGLGPNSRDPILDGPGDELRAVIGPDIACQSALNWNPGSARKRDPFTMRDLPLLVRRREGVARAELRQ
jgi:hypothetical protein